MSKPAPQEMSRKIFYGWKIVAALLVTLTFTSGLSFYNHAVYLSALAEKPAFTVQTASIAVSLFFLSGGITGLWVAKWIQEYDVRLCISFGAVVSFFSLTLLGFVNSVWQLYLVYMLFGVGFSASSLIPATTLVTRWFHKKRAMALSIASTGLSLGGVVVTPICVILVESIGLTKASPIMGLMFLVGVLPVTWLWLRSSPASMGLVADGVSFEDLSVKSSENINQHIKPASTPVTPQNDLLAEGISFADARKGRFFWGLSIAYMFLFMAQVGGISHQFGLAREILSESQTALAVAILPIASIIGRLIGGWVLGQVSIRSFAISMMVLQVLSLSLLASGFNAVSLCIGLGLFGVTVGNILMLQPLLIAEAFGVKDYARIFSVCNLMSSWGTAAGPAVLGFVYVANNNLYALPYAIIALAGLLGVYLFIAGGKIKQY